MARSTKKEEAIGHYTAMMHKATRHHPKGIAMVSCSFVYINYKETLFLFGASSHPYISFYTKVGTLGEMCMRGTAN